jgi:hypothetical protein
MFSQVADRKPEIRFGDSAKDLGGGPLGFRVLGAEQDSASPHPILRPPHLQTDSDTLSFEPNGGKIVDDCFSDRRNCLPCRLCGHVEPGLVCAKIYDPVTYAIRQVRGAGCEGVRVGG